MHACSTAPGSCASDEDCTAWQDCGAVDHVCALTPGMCGTGGDCEGWQECTAGHLCATAPGFCAMDADCTAWQDCGMVDHVCTLTPGMCGTGTDCETWQECSPANVCATAPAHCADAGECAVWEVCNASHVCENGPGYCASSAECASWQECDALHACILAPGYCADDAGCAAWETCPPATHVCALLPGACGTASDCQEWETCDPGHACALDVGRCTSASDCASWQLCDSAHVCVDEQLDPAGVIVTGEFQGSDYPVYGLTGFAPIDAPTHARWVLGASGVLSSSIDPSGNLDYLVLEAGGETIRRFVPDPLRWDPFQYWSAPLAPFDNDPVLVTHSTACPRIGKFILQAGTGAILYRCVYSTPEGFYDEGGTLRMIAQGSGDDVLAWTAGGFMLGLNDSSPVVIDPAGVATLVTGLPRGFIAEARAEGTGFRVAYYVYNFGEDSLESWIVGADAVATREGTFAAAPLGIAPSGDIALDPAGNVFSLDGFVGVVVKRPLEPGVSTVVYEENVPPGANDSRTVPFQPYLTVSAGFSALVTGP